MFKLWVRKYLQFDAQKYCLSEPTLFIRTLFFLAMKQKNQFAHLIDLEEDMDAIDDDIGNELLAVIIKNCLFLLYSFL